MTRLVSNLGWLVVALAGAGALAAIALSRGEPVNGLFFVVAAGGTYLVAYRFYSAFIAAKVLALEEAVAEAIRGLKERGFESPYLRAFVVARINPLRFKRGAKADFDETIERMTASARRFDAGKIRADQVARAAGPAEEAGPA